MIERVTGFRCRVGCDINKYVIAFFRAVQQGWIPPDGVTEEQYQHVKENKDQYPPELVAFVGIYCSFAASWFGVYAWDKKHRNYAAEGVRSIARQLPMIKDVLFFCMAYNELPLDRIPKSIIYCDPPYRATEKAYIKDIDYDSFYDWCVYARQMGHYVYISEYDMPQPFQCIYEHHRAIGTYRKEDRRERLFML
jgi:DNA adenine methylase